MRRLVTISAVLVLLLTAAVASAREFGSSNSPGFIGIFTNPDGTACQMPCMFGIRPGEMRIEDAVAMLTSHPLTRWFTLLNTDPYRFEAQADRIIDITLLNRDDGIVDEITLSWYVRYGGFHKQDFPAPLPEPGSLGEALTIFGLPDFVQLVSSGDASIAFIDSHLMVTVPKSAWPIGPIQTTSLVNHLTMFSMSDCPDNAFAYVFLRWVGLATFRRYVRADTVETMLRPLRSAALSYAPCTLAAGKGTSG